MKSASLLKQLQEAFKYEAKERLETISSSLITLEKAASFPDKQKPILEIIFREAHGLKGASRVINVTEIEKLSQSLEEVFEALKREEISLSQGLFGRIRDMVDRIEQILSNLANERPLVQGVI